MARRACSIPGSTSCTAAAAPAAARRAGCSAGPASACCRPRVAGCGRRPAPWGWRLLRRWRLRRAARCARGRAQGARRLRAGPPARTGAGRGRGGRGGPGVADRPRAGALPARRRAGARSRPDAARRPVRGSAAAGECRAGASWPGCWSSGSPYATRRAWTAASAPPTWPSRWRCVPGSGGGWSTAAAPGHLVVCDDVLTTGATAREAQRALEDAGLRVHAVVTVAATRKRVLPQNSRSGPTNVR